MIISHSRKFIFIKSTKTAGTSLETALSSYCSGEDVVTPLGDYEFNKDPSGRWTHRAMNAGDFQQHDGASTIRDRVGPLVWGAYLKFSIVRNPWDRVVSRFTWMSRNERKPHGAPGLLNHLLGRDAQFEQTRSRFRDFVVEGKWDTNDRFYVIDDELCIDFAVRYEHLSDDVVTLCDRLDIPVIELPRLKSGFRDGQHHYSEYYDDQTRAIVGDRHRNDVRFFGYRFEVA